MNSFHMRLISSGGVFFDGRVNSVIVHTLDGDVELQAHHIEVVVAVEVSELKYRTDEDNVWHTVFVGLGTAQFANNRCMILVDTCELPENIDAARAEAAKERAEEQIRQKKSIEEYKVAQASLSRALSRLKETRK